MFHYATNSKEAYYVNRNQKNQEESKADFWHRHIANCCSSSLTQAQYCKEHFLAMATFCYWKKKFQMTRQEKARFYPLTVPIRSQAGLSLHLCKDKFRIDLAENFSEPALKKLVTILEQL
jgi:hypothetical protein